MASVALVHVLFVPIIPFHYYYRVDLNDSQAVERVYNSDPVFFDAFSRPPGVPLLSANFGVWGFQSIGASLFNFGVVNDAVCSFNPATAIAYGPGLLVLTVPLTVLMIMGLALFLLRKERDHRLTSLPTSHRQSESPITLAVF